MEVNHKLTTQTNLVNLYAVFRSGKKNIPNSSLIELVQQGMFPAQIARALNCSKANVSKRLARLERDGKIESLYRSSFKAIMVSDTANQKVNHNLHGVSPPNSRVSGSFGASPSGGERQDTLHNLILSFRIKSGKPRVCGFVKVGETTVRVCEHSIKVYPPHVPITDPGNPDLAETRARRIAREVARFIQERYQLELDLAHEVTERRPHYGIYHPFADKISEEMQFSDSIAGIDRSHEKYGHFDMYSAQDVKDFLHMPALMERVLRELEEFRREKNNLQQFTLLHELQSLREEMRQQKAAAHA